MKNIYNIPKRTCGVYLLTCTINGKRYVGSSVCIPSRLSTHFGRDARKYMDRELYSDIRRYGRENFIWEVLEECDRDALIEKEAECFDKLHPEYNEIRPCKCSFSDKYVRGKAHSTKKYYDSLEKRKVMYRTEEYRKKFSEIQNKRKKKIEVLKDGKVVETFNSFSDCKKWLNETTEYVGKNKVSKIKSVCDGERPSAYGYFYKYAENL